jgi:hypothetical protein
MGHFCVCKIYGQLDGRVSLWKASRLPALVCGGDGRQAEQTGSAELRLEAGTILSIDRGSNDDE